MPQERLTKTRTSYWAKQPWKSWRSLLTLSKTASSLLLSPLKTLDSFLSRRHDVADTCTEHKLRTASLILCYCATSSHSERPHSLAVNLNIDCKQSLTSNIPYSIAVNWTTAQLHSFAHSLLLAPRKTGTSLITVRQQNRFQTPAAVSLFFPLSALYTNE